MSYDLFLVRESNTFPRNPETINPALDEVLENVSQPFVPSDSQAQQIEDVFIALESLGVENVMFGYEAEDLISINLSYWPDSFPALPSAVETLNQFRSTLGDEWFFYDPQFETTDANLKLTHVQDVFMEVLGSELRAPGLAGMLGFPAHMTTSQKWRNIIVFALLGLLTLYIIFWK